MANQFNPNTSYTAVGAAGSKRRFATPPQGPSVGQQAAGGRGSGNVPPPQRYPQQSGAPVFDSELNVEQSGYATPPQAYHANNREEDQGVRGGQPGYTEYGPGQTVIWTTLLELSAKYGKLEGKVEALSEAEKTSQDNFRNMLGLVKVQLGMMQDNTIGHAIQQQEAAAPENPSSQFADFGGVNTSGFGQPARESAAPGEFSPEDFIEQENLGHQAQPGPNNGQTGAAYGQNGSTHGQHRPNNGQNGSNNGQQGPNNGQQGPNNGQQGQSNGQHAPNYGQHAPNYGHSIRPPVNPLRETTVTIALHLDRHPAVDYLPQLNQRMEPATGPWIATHRNRQRHHMVDIQEVNNDCVLDLASLAAVSSPRIAHPIAMYYYRNRVFFVQEHVALNVLELAPLREPEIAHIFAQVMSGLQHLLLLGIGFQLACVRTTITGDVKLVLNWDYEPGTSLHLRHAGTSYLAIFLRDFMSELGGACRAWSAEACDFLRILEAGYLPSSSVGVFLRARKQR
ncbi:hypothetical protein PWT90_08802 [Aphanocladium album]|nr:hypothetical protein PWT90_08802 [Aphanocladium album]